MTTAAQPRHSAYRGPKPSYQEILDGDTHPVPDVLRSAGLEDIGPLEIPIDWYLSRDIHELEKTNIWRRRWQVACREEDIPAVGDTTIYEVADLSILIVHTAESEMRAYYNSCLHRGRALRDFPGRISELQCPFHGFTWNLDGSPKRFPCEWDFAHIDRGSFHLPEVRVGTWGGFVFINPDPGAASLMEFLGELDSHFARWPLEERYKSVHVAKVINANWKLTQEAFMESYHTVTTHPELLLSLGDANSQYDAFGNFSRAMSASATASPHLSGRLSEQEILDGALYKWDDEDRLLSLPQGATARSVYASVSRERLRPILGEYVDRLCDAEVIDAIYYTLYPNLHPWAGFQSSITYRFRPYGDDHQRSIMECMFLAPFAGPRPPAAPIHWLGDDENWLAAPELGLLANVFQQDMINLERLHTGLKNNQRRTVVFGRYQELKIRHFYSIYARDMNLAGAEGVSHGG